MPLCSSLHPLFVSPLFMVGEWAIMAHHGFLSLHKITFCTLNVNFLFVFLYPITCFIYNALSDVDDHRSPQLPILLLITFCAVTIPLSPLSHLLLPYTISFQDMGSHGSPQLLSFIAVSTFSTIIIFVFVILSIHSKLLDWLLTVFLCFTSF